MQIRSCWHRACNRKKEDRSERVTKAKFKLLLTDSGSSLIFEGEYALHLRF